MKALSAVYPVLQVVTQLSVAISVQISGTAKLFSQERAQHSEFTVYLHRPFHRISSDSSFSAG